ncbi:MAG: hypothetical protein M3033_17615 [Acidobacteriota bacterium]|nr:hypothetical protein [Acidobacteriota bacterium]
MIFFIENTKILGVHPSILILAILFAILCPTFWILMLGKINLRFRKKMADLFGVEITKTVRPYYYLDSNYSEDDAVWHVVSAPLWKRFLIDIINIIYFFTAILTPIVFMLIGLGIIYLVRGRFD